MKNIRSISLSVFLCVCVHGAPYERDSSFVPLFESIDLTGTVSSSSPEHTFHNNSIEPVSKRPVRVLLQNTEKQAVLFCPRLHVSVQSGDSLIRESVVPGPLAVQVLADGTLKMSSEPGQPAANVQVCFDNAETGIIRYNNKPYRGSIVCTVSDNRALTVVNRLPVEDYLRGVVPLEIGASNPHNYEAIKAQAVAARTYTYKRMQKNAHKPFDLHSDVNDQVYGGAAAEKPLSDSALLQTSGLALYHHDTLINSYYSSTCGGATAALHHAWSYRGAGPVPYLVSVHDSNFCEHAPRYIWTERWHAQELEQMINRYCGTYVEHFVPGRLEDLKVGSRFPCGRVRELIIIISGRRYIVSGDATRWVLRCNRQGYPILNSARFSIVKNGTFYEISGSGFGHGVGMCQYGAMGMAQRGYGFKEILSHYYTGITIQ